MNTQLEEITLSDNSTVYNLYLWNDASGGKLEINLVAIDEIDAYQKSYPILEAIMSATNGNTLIKWHLTAHK
jgi:hypothetical protein